MISPIKSLLVTTLGFAAGILLPAESAPAASAGSTSAVKPGTTVPPSKILGGLTWLGPRIPASGPYKSDTFPVTWADDDIIYSSGGDPVSEKKPDGLDVISFQGDPKNPVITVLNEMPGFNGWGGHGLKPTGMLSRHGILYLFTQNLGLRTNENAEKCHGYDSQIFFSKDKGRSWEPEIESVRKTPMFPGREFGAPCFVNYGKDNAGATDGFVYALSGQGWANGNALKVGRVPADKIMDVAAWEFVGNFGAGREPVWVRDYKASVTVLEDPGFLGMVDCVYISSLKRYLVLSWKFKVERADKYSPDDGSDLVVYEGPQPWGPFSLVARMDWESPAVTPYQPRLALKWFDADKLEGWLLFSGTWRENGTSEYYRPQMRRFKLERLGASGK